MDKSIKGADLLLGNSLYPQIQQSNGAKKLGSRLDFQVRARAGIERNDLPISAAARVVEAHLTPESELERAAVF